MIRIWFDWYMSSIIQGIFSNMISLFSLEIQMFSELYSIRLGIFSNIYLHRSLKMHIKDNCPLNLCKQDTSNDISRNIFLFQSFKLQKIQQCIYLCIVTETINRLCKMSIE